MNNVSSGTFNIGAANHIRIGDLAQQISQLFGGVSKLNFCPPPIPRSDEIDDRRPNFMRLKCAGYEPQYGLTETLEWIQREMKALTASIH